ncbi:MAG TPA: HAMP domain-containing sensor histidine kinase [Bacillota bacterium]|nr:HAMP domain-containing sensor histidine kinase [Bacillota bacterium]
MKLQYQLNIAFTTLLLVILAVTGYVIYSLLLNLLIQDEQRQLEQKGTLLVDILNEEYGGQENMDDIQTFLQNQDLQLFVYDRAQDAVLYTTLRDDLANGFITNNDFSDQENELWEYGSDKFVLKRIPFYPKERGIQLILLTPLTDLQVVQHSFVARLLIVFLIGAVAAVLLSYFLTNKLVTPLSRLKRQLKKIENRQFDDVERVKATGEIKEVEQSVFDMASALESYMRSQQAFFQNASHELKTPLMTIQGYAEGIRDHIFTKEYEEKGLEVMVAEVKRLKAIINEMILLAKLDSEEAEYEPQMIEAKSLIRQIADRGMPISSEQHVELITDVSHGAMVYADGEKVLRALSNVTFNALRHANEKVSISVTYGNTYTSFVIEDDGEGISDEMLPHIFHRFVKGKDGETGLGLAIARAIVEQSGGNITVGESTELGGARFVLTFPNKK